jgi:hypothetical protein
VTDSWGSDVIVSNGLTVLQAGSTTGKSFAQKMGASIHGQGKLPSDLLNEKAIAFLAQIFQLLFSIFFSFSIFETGPSIIPLANAWPGIGTGT